MAGRIFVICSFLIVGCTSEYRKMNSMIEKEGVKLISVYQDLCGIEFHDLHPEANHFSTSELNENKYRIESDTLYVDFIMASYKNAIIKPDFVVSNGVIQIQYDEVIVYEGGSTSMEACSILISHKITGLDLTKKYFFPIPTMKRIDVYK